jgi:ABC-type transporter Mla subunit MlaD
MDINEAYIVMQEASGLQVGDKVRVLRKAKSYEMG